MKNALWILLIVPALAACEEAKPGTPPGPAPMPAQDGKQTPPGEPVRITVQHILVAFKDAHAVKQKQAQGQMKEVVRSRADAQELARTVFELAKTGHAINDLKAKYRSDDGGPGEYEMSNFGVPVPQGVTPRSGMVPAFGNVGFKLEVGDVGMAEYHETDSPYGWHIIRRVK